MASRSRKCPKILQVICAENGVNGEFCAERSEVAGRSLWREDYLHGVLESWFGWEIWASWSWSWEALHSPLAPNCIFSALERGEELQTCGKRFTRTVLVACRVSYQSDQQCSYQSNIVGVAIPTL